MSDWHHRLAVVFGASCLALTGPAFAQHHSPKKQLVTQAPAAPEPAAPPVADPPPTLEQMPASAPKVSFRNGQLTIIAPNSTLGDILRAVRSQTGASVEIPENATERVVAQLGPGPARDVLASLLNGSHFNYVMLGSATDPEQVEKIILTSKAGIAPAGADGTTPRAGSPTQAILQQAAETPEEMTEEPAEEANDSENQGDNQVPPPDAAQTAQPNGQPAIKTPEQLLQELQRQQQIQQQQQQQQPAGTPQPVPIPRTQPPQ